MKDIYHSCFLVALLLGFVLTSCQYNDNEPSNANLMTPDPQPSPLSFLALGDSYTIGEAVDENERWPMQLVHALGTDSLMIPKIIATTGWTTSELQAGIQAEMSAGVLEKSYGVVSLLIGVNNQYRGQDTATYRKEFTELLDQAIGFAEKGKEATFVVSIPDYGLTPFVANANKDPEVIAKELDWYNATAKEIAMSKGVAFIDITPISRRAADDASLIATDGLHPSGKMYKAWVEEEIMPSVKSIYQNIIQ